MSSLLLDVKNRSLAEEMTGDNVLDAAKNLLSSTLTPVTAGEEKIILSCQKVVNEANSLELASLTNYKNTKQCLQRLGEINNDFKATIQSVKQYREQLGTNTNSVSSMCNTLNENEESIKSRMQRGRTASSQTRSQSRLVQEKIEQLQEENDTLAAEIEEAERKLNEMKARKREVEKQLNDCLEQRDTLTKTDEGHTKNETYLTSHQESIQTTKRLIDESVGKLKDIDSTTSQRMLNTCLEYYKFLKLYFQYANQLQDNLNGKIQTMHDRIDTQVQNIEEIPVLELAMDKNKIEQLEDEYKHNLVRFDRRKTKVGNLIDSIRVDYFALKDQFSAFGREIEPLE